MANKLTTEEGNVLIAKFMGAHQYPKGKWYCLRSAHSADGYVTTERLAYHTSVWYGVDSLVQIDSTPTLKTSTMQNNNTLEGAQGKEPPFGRKRIPGESELIAELEKLNLPPAQMTCIIHGWYKAMQSYAASRSVGFSLEQVKEIAIAYGGQLYSCSDELKHAMWGTWSTKEGKSLLERSMPVEVQDWLSVEKDGLPEWGKPLFAISEFLYKDKPKTEMLYCFLDADGECVILPTEEDYGWKFAECITHYIYADKIIPALPENSKP